MARILLVGIAALDIITTVHGYPAEDSEVRAHARRVVRGGNAANTAVVLGQLGQQCSFAGVLVATAEAQVVIGDLHRHGIDLTPSPVVRTGALPTSYIVVNSRNGSRTIVHYRDLREFSARDLQRTDVRCFDWVHFEGRNIRETVSMMRRVRRECPSATVSVEIEKRRTEGEEQLFALADVLVFSRAYVRGRGHERPEPWLDALRHRGVNALLICPWAEAGAVAMDTKGAIQRVTAYPPARVRDTIGAGDTFNAGLIDRLVSGAALDDALDAASRLAGRKCGQLGFDHLARCYGCHR